jgi:hypothetical protein
VPFDRRQRRSDSFDTSELGKNSSSCRKLWIRSGYKKEGAGWPLRMSRIPLDHDVRRSRTECEAAGSIFEAEYRAKCPTAVESLFADW